MLRIMGWCVVAIVGVVAVINAAFMLASPRVWFRLPEWIRMQGSLSQNKYADGWGAIQVRLTGAVILLVIAWVLYDSLF